MDDGHRPLAVDVDVVAGGVEVPAAHAGRAAADLGEVQPLRPGEPLHVGGRRADAEGGDHGPAHLLDLVVAGLAVDAVGGDELRRDPPRPHRLQHVRVVVRGELHGHGAVDADRVVEALVALDELLDGDLGTVVDAAAGDGLGQLVGCVDPFGTGRSGPGRRLEHQREPDLRREPPDVVAGAGRRRRRAADAGLAQHVLHRRLVAAEEGRALRRAGDAARLAHPRRGHHVGLDRGLQPVDLDVLLQPAHDVVQAALVDDGGHLLVVAEPPGDVAVEPVLRSLADADDGGPDVVEGAGELLLVVREARLDQHHVHDGLDDT